MKFFLSFALSLFYLFAFPQVGAGNGNPVAEPGLIAKKATIDQYRIISHQRDTTFVDTSLTIHSEYRFNYLRRDNFGLLPFANEGQTYNILDFRLVHPRSSYPGFGFRAKHVNYLSAEQINYYSVATPFTELYFKTVMEQGQSLDAFLTLNTSERNNFSIAYKGLRSLGKYVNQLSSTGNFRFTHSFNTKNRRYFSRFHFVAQDILNGENGGIASITDFESDNPDFDNRARLAVYLQDAESFLKGHRIYLDHHFRINSLENTHGIGVFHQFEYEYKSFEFRQRTVTSSITLSDGTVTNFNRFGESFSPGNLHDKTRNNRIFNRGGLSLTTPQLGSLRIFADHFTYNYFYNRILILDDGPVPSLLSDEITSAGAEYAVAKGRISAKLFYATGISGAPHSNLKAHAGYYLNPEINFQLKFSNLSKIPDHIFNLHQSSYEQYNWSNDFSNEKINELSFTANTKWVTASASYKTISDHLYFSDDDATEQVQLVSPKQFDQTINYLALCLAREFRFGKFALDNTILYQSVRQAAAIINVPEFTTRNSLYYSNHFFKRALYVQTGFTLNYFTGYFANDYSPVLGEHVVQAQREIGDFPMLDFFVNARVKQARIFLKAEHFNTLFSPNNYYSAPNYPYRDFLIRFGLVWNFFQ